MRKASAKGARIPSSWNGRRMGVFYAFCLFLSRLAALTLFEIRVHGARRVPGRGPVILAANHQSLLDPWLVGLVLRRQALYLARDSLFRIPIFGRLIWNLGSLPVPRESQAPRVALDVCSRALEQGWGLVLFPEGTRSSDGRLQPLKRGIALIARRSGAPILPVLVRGSHALWPRGRMLPRPGCVEIHFGEPIRHEKESSDSFMDRLRAAYVRLALETGADEVLPLAAPGTEPWAGGVAARPPSPPLNASTTTTAETAQAVFAQPIVS